jgi:hypothetical protein
VTPFSSAFGDKPPAEEENVALPDARLNDEMDLRALSESELRPLASSTVSEPTSQNGGGVRGANFSLFGTVPTEHYCAGDPSGGGSRK